MNSRSTSTSGFWVSAVIGASAARDHLYGVAGTTDPEQVAFDLVRGGVLERGEEFSLLLHHAGRARAQHARAGQHADLEGAGAALEGPRVVVAPGLAGHSAAGIEGERDLGARGDRDDALVAVVVADDLPRRGGETGRRAGHEGHGAAVELELEHQLALVEQVGGDHAQLPEVFAAQRTRWAGGHGGRPERDGQTMAVFRVRPGHAVAIGPDGHGALRRELDVVHVRIGGRPARVVVEKRSRPLPHRARQRELRTARGLHRTRRRGVTHAGDYREARDDEPDHHARPGPYHGRTLACFQAERNRGEYCYHAATTPGDTVTTQAEQQLLVDMGLDRPGSAQVVLSRNS